MTRVQMWPRQERMVAGPRSDSWSGQSQAQNSCFRGSKVHENYILCGHFGRILDSASSELRIQYLKGPRPGAGATRALDLSQEARNRKLAINSNEAKTQNRFFRGLDAILGQQFATFVPSRFYLDSRGSPILQARKQAQRGE